MWTDRHFLLLFLASYCIGLPTLRGPCSPATVEVRKEWGELTPDARIDYITAVTCMKQKPPVLPPKHFPGVQNRYDDFVATHINYTLNTHNSGIFLSWHRHFVWVWEKALREECGYKGTQPYWNWALWPDLAASPLFDGSPTSLSGDGEFDPTETAIFYPSDDGKTMTIPRGTGGGCLNSGPFTNWTVRLGPFNMSEAFLDSLRPTAFADNPRCLSRSLNSWVIDHFNNQVAVDRVLSTRTITEFQQAMQNFPFKKAFTLGPHDAGHRSLGKDMLDLFASPQDPAFMLHHGMVDRLWTMWQNTDEAGRRYALNGSSSSFYKVNTPPVTLDTTVEFGILDRPRTLVELMNPREYDYCYRYS
ncbi:hypothetical protein CNMCM7691_003893 [Aspergillus felis]|uniref:Tyrosinase copper-binding domain-containing protein n=1 Tax=Aspergillus felis TaxID=1287682 RepID=A0A8H6VCY1_9EURO|nr:hypothetical protein CNMCM7691_003893 [Aspergillus felis]